MSSGAPKGLQFLRRHANGFIISGLQQAAVLFWAASELDGAPMLRFLLVATGGYLTLVIIILIRRNGSETSMDRFAIAWGYPIIIPLVVFEFVVMRFLSSH